MRDLLIGCAFLTITTMTGLQPEMAMASVADTSAETRSDERAAAGKRGAELLQSIEKWFRADGETGLYREHYPQRPSDGAYADEWPFSQVHIGVLDMAGVAGEAGAAHERALDAHHRAQMLYWMPQAKGRLAGFSSRVVPPHGQGGDLYFDDNEWVGLAAMQRWAMSRDAASLDLARQIFTLVRSAWDDNPDHPSPGGLFWTEASWNRDRNTVSNMPAAQLGLRLFQATGDQSYLRDALRYYEWTNRTLQRRDGLYLDHIGLDGEIDRRIFSYNQGVPVGVNVLLYKATGEARYLAEAKRIAERSFGYFVTEGRLDRHSMPFNAIYFKNLLLLESVTGGTRYRQAMRDYAERMWRDHRDAQTGLIRRPGRDRSDRFNLIDQGAMLQIQAVLAWDPDDYARLY